MILKKSDDIIYDILLLNYEERFLRHNSYYVSYFVLGFFYAVIPNIMMLCHRYLSWYKDL
jgi:hypothetical protein